VGDTQLGRFYDALEEILKYYSSFAEFLNDVRDRQNQLVKATGGHVWIDVHMKIPVERDTEYAIFLVDKMSEGGWGQDRIEKRTPVKVRIT